MFGRVAKLVTLFMLNLDKYAIYRDRVHFFDKPEYNTLQNLSSKFYRVLYSFSVYLLSPTI